MKLISKENARIENFLSRETGAPKKLFLKLIRKKKVKTNKKIAAIGSRVLVGDEIILEEPITIQKNLPKKFCDISSYESKNFLIINKPYGIASQKGKGIKISLDEVMLSLASEKNDKSFITHRLDKNTTGAMLFSKDLEFTQIIGRMFQTQTISKAYIAVIEGYLENKTEIRAKIEEKQAISVFIPMLYLGSNTLCMIFTKFGRKHQIRIHASLLGHPLYGDEYYGSSKENFFLHCFSLSFLEFRFFAQPSKIFYKYVNSCDAKNKISFSFLLNFYYQNSNGEIFFK